MEHRFFRRHRWQLSAVAIVAITVVSICAGCVSGRTYRTQLKTSDYCTASFAGDCAQDVLHLAAATPPDATPVLVGFVEFDDQGYLRRPDLKDQLVAHVRSLAQDRPLLIAVFAHGWKHNADANDGNVLAFNRLLNKLAIADAAVCANGPCQNRQVIGIYLGWRGLSNRIEPFNTLSFWARKAHAHLVGGDGVTEVLAELAKIKAMDRPGERLPQSRLIITGHSFGGAVIYNAVNQMLIRDTAFLNQERVPRSVADLIVLVNPAFEAARFHAIQRKAAGFTFKAGQKPILAVFTSEADLATKRAFPAGRALSTVFSEHRDVEQRRENVQAIGHYAPFRTHSMTLSDGQGGTPADLSDLACTWQSFSNGSSDHWEAGLVTLRRLAPPGSGSQRFNPYMVASVEKGIISGHSDIWGEQFADFLYRFVAVQTYGLCPGPSSNQQD